MITEQNMRVRNKQQVYSPLVQKVGKTGLQKEGLENKEFIEISI